MPAFFLYIDTIRIRIQLMEVQMGARHEERSVIVWSNRGMDRPGGKPHVPLASVTICIKCGVVTRVELFTNGEEGAECGKNGEGGEKCS
ncbi:MAG: hypothetical protein UY53_C0002G0030 [Parcubacteria group bacterium GW2011_GWA2_50_10]|nr:MAG: hypothetical protein UY25_C0002G0041 [Candidatus Yanofskybacteria bacterium GW2011_GWC1_48_11]KKW04712.1 MAG: hypothetical protein UY38_C0001G0279 [Parcubacteria group bacterium GW2011_GWB1_49_12]KKW08989.1 MAG: hypothetical protein UY45_C0002G0041 [Parcubacteria group bacterium GW2011_GWA1_49_26]KKW14241.1 MAG: hypothetical protein UY53_C0002G0030 [Parcubacteria group bacterium GW2011_GWA2_50_10]